MAEGEPSSTAARFRRTTPSTPPANSAKYLELCTPGIQKIRAGLHVVHVTDRKQTSGNLWNDHTEQCTLLARLTHCGV